MKLIVILSGIIGCQAVFKPADLAALQAAVNSCVPAETSSGSGCDSSSYGPIGEWDVSSVTSLAYLFNNKKAFNQDLSKWDVSRVTSLQSTFLAANTFNSVLSTWDVSKVTSLYYAFNKAYAFNQDLSKWDVSQVTTFFGTFAYTSNFKQDLSKWNVSSALSMNLMFYDSGFDRTLCGDKWQEHLGNNYLTSTGRYGCCDAGSYMSKPHLNPFSKATACETCPVGQYGSTVDDDITSCNHCGTGKYQNTEGQVLCKICPLGTYQNNTGQSAQSSCKDCPLATYQDVSGQSSCKDCPSGESTLYQGSTTDDCFTALEIKQKFLEERDPALVPAYNIAKSCVE